MRKCSVWLIFAKTKLHVGDENTSSYGLIDNSIQRDSVTNLPKINSSSLKGAINEYATVESDLTPKQCISIFGSDRSGKERGTQKGEYSFFDADLLVIPTLPDNNSNELCRYVYSNEVICRFVDKVRSLGANVTNEILLSKLRTMLGQMTPKDNQQFKSLTSDEELPIIARNVLENGESKNLWYEQVLPEGSVLGTIISSPDTILENVIQDRIIQIGANATIGYGYCKFIKL